VLVSLMLLANFFSNALEAELREDLYDEQVWYLIPINNMSRFGAYRWLKTLSSSSFQPKP
jgi:hypothetical protein